MTVSHFNLIHINCHAAARRADSSLRAAKREWEGATLRNGGTLANNLLPVSHMLPLLMLDRESASHSAVQSNLVAIGTTY